MKYRTTSLILVLIAILISTTPGVEAKRKPTSPATAEVILRAPASEMNAIFSRQGLTEVHCRPAPNDLSVEICRAEGQPITMAQQLVDDIIDLEPGVIGVEVAALASLPESYDDVVLGQDAAVVSGLLGSTGTVSFGTDGGGGSRLVWEGYVDQQAASLLRVTAAQSQYIGTGAVVAIIDSGIDTTHPLFDGHLVPGYDFVLDQAGDASDWSTLDESSMAILGESSMAILGSETAVTLNESSMAILGSTQTSQLVPSSIPRSFGHGTMVAGIVHRVAPGAKLMPLRVFNGEGHATIYDITRAIEYAVDNGATVINMSFSYEGYSEELMRMIKHAKKQGVICIASVGNDGQEALVYPAALNWSIGVASTDGNDYVSDFSNRGDDLVTLTAPGEHIVTAYPGGGWASATGTSFAAPWVSGAVALFADKNGDGTAGSVKFSKADQALSHADAVLGVFDDLVGYGRIDVKSALDNL